MAIIGIVCTLPSKRKPLPFEDDFDSEYDYESVEYDYLRMSDIQKAVKLAKSPKGQRLLTWII